MQTRLTELLGIDLPIIQAPMAGATGTELAIAVSRAGALGSLPGALLTADSLAEQIRTSARTAPHPLNVNFFCHAAVSVAADASRHG